MKIAYIAGKFRGPNAWEVENNIRKAEEVGFLVAGLGIMPLIPHCNTRFFNGTLTDEFWLEGTLELLRRSDVVMTVENWIDSMGARAEVELATLKGIPVVHHLDQLKVWLDDEAGEKFVP